MSLRASDYLENSEYLRTATRAEPAANDVLLPLEGREFWVDQLDVRAITPSRVAPKRQYTLITPKIVVSATQLLDFAVISGLGAFTVRHPPSSVGDQLRYIVVILFVSAMFVFLFGRTGGYQFARLSRMYWQIIITTIIWLLLFAISLVIAFPEYFTDPNSQWWVLRFGAATLSSLWISRIFARLLITRWRRAGIFVQNIVIVGGGPAGAHVIAKLQNTDDFAILGVFDDRTTRIPPFVNGVEVLGTVDDLLSFARRTHVDQVIIALPLRAERRAKLLLEKLKSLPVDLRLSVTSDELPDCLIGSVGNAPVFEIWSRPVQHWNAVAKAFTDRILGAVLLLLLAAPMLFIAATIKLESCGPALFRQKRFGYNNHVINVVKFRTMYMGVSDPSGADRTVRNDQRVTKFGRILRRFSLDELPQLLNVVQGELSLVGPRPHAVAMRVDSRLYYDVVSEYFERHKVKPGITGLAQVSGYRGEVDTIEMARQRVRFDLEYINRWSLWLDLQILLRTVTTVLFDRTRAY